MAAKNESAFRTAFTVSIEAAEGVTTGISAHDRAHTIQVAIDPNTKPEGIVQPGHVFPLKAKDGGVLERAGQTEAAVDLARLAGLIPAGVICEIMNEDGTMARVPDLVPYCERHGLKMITVADLIAYRRRTERLVERVVATRLPTAFGEFTAVGYRSLVDDKHHLAMVKGDVRGQDDVLVRVHSECLTGDVFHSLRCDCGEQLEAALAMIESEGAGVLLYLSQEGRGIGLLNKLRAYRLQEDGLDTVDANLKLGLPADLRDYGIGAQILVDLGLTSIRILTNNPKKIHGLEGYGLSVADQVPIQAVPNPHNEEYLRTKRERLGHTLHHQGLPLDEELIHEEHATRSSARRSARGRPTRIPRMASPGDDRFSDEQRVSSWANEFAICVATFYEELAERLVNGAVEGFADGGVSPASVHTFEVPGAFELPLAAKWCAESGRFAGVACLGAVIRGETTTTTTSAPRPPAGSRTSSSQTGVPCAFGVITCETMEQALARSGGDKRDRAASAAARRDADGADPRGSRVASWRPLPSSAPWPRSASAAARGPRSGTRAATRWSPPGGASTRTCRRSGSTTAAAPAGSTSAPAA